MLQHVGRTIAIKRQNPVDSTYSIVLYTVTACRLDNRCGRNSRQGSWHVSGIVSTAPTAPGTGDCELCVFVAPNKKVQRWRRLPSSPLHETAEKVHTDEFIEPWRDGLGLLSPFEYLMRVPIRTFAYPLDPVPFPARVLHGAPETSPGSHSAQAVRTVPAVGFAGPAINFKKHLIFTTIDVSNT